MRVMNAHLMVARLEPAKVDDFRVTQAGQVLLEGEAEHQRLLPALRKWPARPAMRAAK